MNSLDKMEDYDRLARLCEAKDAEIKRLENIGICLEKSANSLASKLSEAQGKIAMLRELLCVLRAWSYTAGDVEDEYRSHKLFPTNYRPSTQKPLWSAIIHAIDDTQATALAYEREVKAKAAETAIHEYLIDQMNRDYSSWHNQEFAKLMPEFFHRLHAEFWDSIRATNKREVK